MVRLPLTNWVALEPEQPLQTSVKDSQSLSVKREQPQHQPDRFVVRTEEKAFHTPTTQPGAQYAHHSVCPLHPFLNSFTEVDLTCDKLCMFRVHNFDACVHA